MDSVAGIIFSKNRKEVLLIKRRDVPVWVLPGGGIESKETETLAILREVEEETGYKVSIVRKVGEYTPINRLSKFTHLFECTILEGNSKTGEETKDIRFFPMENLPKPLPPPYKEWILDAYENLPFLIRKKLTSVSYFALIKNLFLHPILVLRFLLSKMGFHYNS